jgi:plasmid stabilization system protein ParE
LVEIWYFIAQDDPIAADRLLDLLEEKYKLLADNPHMGPARPDIAKKLRYHPVGNYFAALPSDSRRHRTGSRGAWSKGPAGANVKAKKSGNGKSIRPTEQASATRQVLRIIARDRRPSHGRAR